MRLARVFILVTALVASFAQSSVAAQSATPTTALATPSPTTAKTSSVDTTSLMPCLQVDVSSTMKPDDDCPTITQKAVPADTPTYLFRVGNEDWKSSPSVDNKVRIDNLAPRNHLVLFATGNCPPLPSDPPTQCSLMVQTAIPDPTTPHSLQHPAWNELLHWDKKTGRFVVDKLDVFFKTDPSIRVVINGKEVIGELGPEDTLDDTKLKQNRIWADKALDPETDWAIEVYSVPDGCRDFLPDSKKARLDIINIPGSLSHDQGPANGITLGGPKIFDTFALKQKLAATATQLASISPFSQAQITAQYGSFQGMTRDTSYIAAQLTTSPTPSIVSTASGLANSAVNTVSPSSQSTVGVQATCPAGYYPTTPSTGAVSCTPITVTPGAPSATSVTGTQLTTTTNPATNQTVTTITQPTTQTQTTIPSLQGTVPTAPTLTPFTPPSNVGVSASDMLDEQTRLSSQLTTLQMLLQGASSDQLLLSHQRAYGVRAQTTIGFPISVETPACFHGAVAEVRILVLPHASQSTSQPISIVNLLPTQKTYNVAKVTSNANSFGAGVAVQPISFGLTTGKSKDRMYLAKDTDTVALQYPPAGHSPAFDFTDNPECGDLPDNVKNGGDPDYANYDFDSAVMFGWQFRPVLGAAAVAAGMRTGFAQLAIPQSDALAFSPEVWVQTRWRHYDQKKQLAGWVYPESCHWKRLNDPVSVTNPVVIKDVQVTDEGLGLLRFHATGDLLSSTGQVRSGGLNLAPQYFDGYSLEYFGPAKDILSNGDLQLLDEAMHGQSLVVPTKAGLSCRIKNPTLSAIPMADGNSWLQLDYDRPDYNPDPKADGPQHPLLLIGTDVYGLRDKALQGLDLQQKPVPLDLACARAANNTHCTFTFVAPTDSVRSARNFSVRDPAWDSYGENAPIAMDPAFAKLEALAKTSKDDSTSDDETQLDPRCPKKPPNCTLKKKDPPKPSWFLLSGTDLSSLESAETLTADAPVNYCNCEKGCLQILVDGSDGPPKPVLAKDIKVASDSNVWLRLTQPSGVHVFWSRPGHPASEWDLAIKKDDATGVTGKPAVLYETDSQAVTFTGADFSKVTGVMFETTKLDLVGAPTKAKLVVQVTSAVTAKYGHKELIAQAGVDDKGKPKTITLPLDIVKH